MRLSRKMTAFLLAFLLMLSPWIGVPFATEGFATEELVLKTSVSPQTFSKGDTITVTVTLMGSVESQGFGLDHSAAYDHEVFEWVSGDWSASIKSQSMLAIPMQGTGQAAFVATAPIGISGEVFSFTVKVGMRHLSLAIKSAGSAASPSAVTFPV